MMVKNGLGKVQERYKIKLRKFILVSDEGFFKLKEPEIVYETNSLEDAKNMADKFRCEYKSGCQVSII